MLKSALKIFVYNVIGYQKKKTQQALTQVDVNIIFNYYIHLTLS